MIRSTLLGGSGRAILRLLPGTGFRKRPEYSKVGGERDFLSSNAAMQALNPRVYQMIIFLAP